MHVLSSSAGVGNQTFTTFCDIINDSAQDTATKNRFLCPSHLWHRFSREVSPWAPGIVTNQWIDGLVCVSEDEAVCASRTSRTGVRDDVTHFQNFPWTVVTLRRLLSRYTSNSYHFKIFYTQKVFISFGRSRRLVLFAYIYDVI